MSIRCVFVNADGDRIEADAEPGDDLLSVGQAAGMPLEGTCEGQMACSTCHVLLAAEWFERLPEASEEEEDMLDLAYGVGPTSRLSCQISMTPELDGIVAHIPTGTYDHSR
ncbi:MAG: 2Fe-2S iron-sulfur cluster-binding protein [Pontixanthobacter sp.]